MTIETKNENTANNDDSEFGASFAFTEEDLKNMDPLDRKALAETGGLQGADGADRIAAVEEEDDEVTDVEAKPPTPAPTAAPAAVDPADAAAAALAAEDAGTAAAPAAAPAPAAEGPSVLGELPAIEVLPFTPKAPADADAKIEAADQREADALKKLLDGEIDSDAYAKVKREATNEARTLQQQVSDDRAAQAASNHQAQAAFQRLANQGIGVLRAAGLDVTGNAELADEFNATVRQQAELALKRGIVDGTDLKASRIALERTVISMAAMHGVTLTAKQAAAATAAATPAAPAKAGKPAPRTADLSGIPPTLARTPVAALPDPGRDEFEAFDSGEDPNDNELAFARMTSEQQARFLAN